MEDDARPVRDRLLDAAYELTVRWGWEKVRMADVATAGGCSRQTVYDQFGGREELARELASRELLGLLHGIEAAMDGEDDVPAAIEAATGFVLDLAARNPLVRAIVAEADLDGLPQLAAREEPVLLTARGRLFEYLTLRFTDLDERTRALVADVVSRLLLSYVALSVDPPPTVASRIRDVVSRLLRPEAVAAGRR